VATVAAGIWFVLTVIGVAEGAYTSIHLKRSSISEGAFWGGYGVYGVLIALVCSGLLSVYEHPRDRLSFVVGGCLAVVVPLVLLVRHIHLTVSTSFAAGSESCGSWLSTRLAPQPCQHALDTASREALTVAAGALFLGLWLMASRALREPPASPPPAPTPVSD
jgi:hypothetical protein